MAECPGDFRDIGLVVIARLRQQQARLQVSEPRRHHQVVGGDLELQVPLRRNKAEILVGERQD